MTNNPVVIDLPPDFLAKMSPDRQEVAPNENVVDRPCIAHGGTDDVAANPNCPTCAEIIERQRAKCGQNHAHPLVVLYFKNDPLQPHVIATCLSPVIH